MLLRGASPVALTLAMLAGTAATLKAQSNADGYIYGSAPSGATVTVESVETGLKREAKVADTGSFHISSLPTGQYRVSLRVPGQPVQKADDVTVSLGSGTAVRFGDKTDIVAMDKFKVTGGSYAPIDVSSVESVMVMSTATIEQLPVGRSPTSVALLAPGTTQGVSAFGGLASFSGASVAENAYFVNGFNLTNHFNPLGIHSNVADPNHGIAFGNYHRRYRFDFEVLL